jgi:voltage-gated potassium channel
MTISTTAQKLYVAMVLFFFVVVMGTVGYMFIEGWSFIESLYMTIITLTTIGYGEVHALHPYGRVFTIGLVIAGLGVAFYSISLLTRMLIEGELLAVLGRRKLERQIKELENHFVVCGYGRFGKIIARNLADRGLPFVVIEKDEKVFSRVEEDGFLGLPEDATQDEALLKTGIKKARCLISVVSSDTDNVFIVLSARQLNPNLYIVTRAAEEQSEKKLLRAGANKVVAPYRIGATQMAQAAVQPNVIDFIEIATQTTSLEFQIEEIAVRPTSTLVGKSLKDLGLSRKIGVIIIGVKRLEKMFFNPSAETVINAGDILIALGHPDQLKQLEQMVV